MMQKVIKKVDSGFIGELEDFITTKSWWDSVDGLAVMAGEHFKRYPHLQSQITASWIHSDNIWLQRSALLFQLRYKEDTDWPLLEKYITTVFHNPEFFIQKACGWALRQYSKTNPNAVRVFVEKHTLSTVCRREAVKYI
jgi:3-methyladenine DNA glycosylase AlkD